MLQEKDRVSRAGKSDTDPPRTGTITRVYQTKPSNIGDRIWLCDVRWDDTGEEGVGYIVSSSGLTKI